MNISKISRSIVVVIFIVIIIFLGYLNFSNLLNNKNSTIDFEISPIIKIGFVFLVIILSLIYIGIKDKLYKKHIKRNIAFIYRYAYIVLVLIGATIIASKKMLLLFSDNKIMLFILLNITICFLIKKIIFNVSKSDILSVFGMFTYALLPSIEINSRVYIYSRIFALIILAAILVFQVLIDELKQKDIKTKRYIVLTILFGFLIGLTTLFGISVWVWVATIVLTSFITYNLDRTHITFPKKFLAALDQTKRESLYKIERININKLIVVILLSILILFAVNFAFSKVITMMNFNADFDFIIEKINESTISNINLNKDIIMTNLINVSNVFVSSSSMFYLFISLYIIFMEILAICLHRRYDTKSTVMKLIFIMIFACLVVFNLDILYFRPILTILLILIAIVNTSNIYLNREERIKMLVA